MVAIRIPVRIVVLVLVVPVRMAWDVLVVAGRFLNDTVFRPVGRALLWLGRAVFVWPFVALWRYAVVPAGQGLARLGTRVARRARGVAVPVRPHASGARVRVAGARDRGRAWGGCTRACSLRSGMR